MCLLMRALMRCLLKGHDHAHSERHSNVCVFTRCAPLEQNHRIYLIYVRHTTDQMRSEIPEMVYDYLATGLHGLLHTQITVHS